MRNVVDQVNDFLTVQNNFPASLFESTAKAQARQIFENQSYLSAGVISEDGVIWDIITEMMASFLGATYLSGSGNLVLEIEDGTVSQYNRTIIRKSDAEIVDAKLSLSNIVNQCPCNYAYNYAAGEFKRETNDSTHADAISQGIYGVSNGIGYNINGTNRMQLMRYGATVYSGALYENAVMWPGTDTGFANNAKASLVFNADGGVLTWTKNGSPTGTLAFTVIWER